MTLDKENIVRLNLNMSKDLHTRLKVYATLRHTSISAVVTEAIEDLMKKAEAEKDGK